MTGSVMLNKKTSVPIIF